MPILYRYIIREISAVFIAVNLVLLTVLLSFRLSSLLAGAASGKFALSAVWQLIGLQAVRFLVVLMPLAFVLAVVMAFGRLYRDSEMTAVLSCGIAPQIQQRALLICVLPVVVLVLSLTLAVLPEVYQTQENLKQKARQEAVIVLFAPNTFRRLDNNIVIHTGAIKNGVLQNFFITYTEPNQYSIITADTGEMKTTSTQRRLVLHHGRRLAWSDDHNPERTVLTTFATADFRLPGESTEQSSDRLRNIPTRALGSSKEHLSEWQTRLNPALALLIFTFILPLLARTQPRSGRYNRVLPAFLLFALYINGLDLLTVAVRKGKIAPFPGSLYLHAAVLLLIILTYRYHRRIP